MSRDNSGSLSRNERKEKETHPDMKGKCVINGTAYWISGWTKENDRGKWLSLSFEPVEERRETKRAKAPESDIPW